MLEVIILTRMRMYIAEPSSISAQLSSGAWAALIFVWALDYLISLCVQMCLTFGRHTFQIVSMASCLKM